VLSDDGDGPPRGVLVAAVVVAVAAVIGRIGVRDDPAEAGTATSRRDRVGTRTAGRWRRLSHLLAALPDRLGDYQRAVAAEPAPVGAAAWQANPEAEPLILRCGIERPVEFVAGTPVQVVDDVDWFRIGDEGRSTWITVDRPVYIGLTLPDGSGPTPIQLISEAIAKAMPAVAVNPGPVK